MPWRRSQLAPYGSVRGLLRFLHEASRHGWPARLDAPFLQRTGLRGGSAWELLVALRFFGLVDPASDRPTQRYALLLRPWPEARQAVAEAIHNAYTATLGAADWTGWESQRLERAFAERYGKDLARRQARFAQGLARALGLSSAFPLRRRRDWEALAEGRGVGEGPPAEGRPAALPPRLPDDGAGQTGSGADEGREEGAAGREGDDQVLRRRYAEVLLRRLERAGPEEAEALARRLDALLGIPRRRSGLWGRLLAFLRPRRTARR